MEFLFMDFCEIAFNDEHEMKWNKSQKFVIDFM